MVQDFSSQFSSASMRKIYHCFPNILYIHVCVYVCMCVHTHIYIYVCIVCMPDNKRNECDGEKEEKEEELEEKETARSASLIALSSDYVSIDRLIAIIIHT